MTADASGAILVYFTTLCRQPILSTGKICIPTHQTAFSSSEPNSSDEHVILHVVLSSDSMKKDREKLLAKNYLDSMWHFSVEKHSLLRVQLLGAFTHV